MRSLLILSVAIFFAVSCAAQSDLLILKKNYHTIKTFFPGSEMTFSTSTNFYKAYVSSINDDSVFLIQYEIRQIPTTLGVYILDTVSTYRFAINYHDIISFGKSRNGFDISSSGAALFGGGILLTTAGLVTWIFTKPGNQYYANPQLIIGAAVLAGIGYLLMKSGNKNMKLGKKYSLDYIKVK